MANAIRCFELNTGAKIPSVGLGTYRADTHVVSDVIAAAIKIGYRHIDCAQMYGNEKEVHWPVSMKKGSVGSDPHNLTQPNIPSTWKAMEALFDSGKARAIGVCNFSSKKLGDLLEVARIPPAVNQVELHPHWQQLKLHAFCKSKGIHLTGFAPLARNKVLTNPIVNLVAEKLGKTTAQVTLRWGLQMGHSLVPKSTNPERIRENFDIFNWSIPEDLFAKFSEINQERLIKGTGFVHETLGAYRTVEELWDGE